MAGTIPATTSSRDLEAHFEADASVVFHLGEHLVSDVVQALVELVKNSYDADATYANVVIDTASPPPVTMRSDIEGDVKVDAAGASRMRVGYVLIEDDGAGMDVDTIREGWLTIANSPKTRQKRAGRPTLRGRTPLGDKGLGRLGVQRLGQHVSINTRVTRTGLEPQEEHQVQFSWRAFRQGTSLSNVPVSLTEVDPPTRSVGTSIVVADLRDREQWTDPAAVDRLRQELSQMISPFEGVRDFRLIVSINGTGLDLGEVSTQLREAAQVRYTLEFDGTTFTVNGRAKLSFFRPPQGTKDRIAFAELVEADDGQRFFAYLAQQARNESFSFRKARRAGWFVEFSRARPLADFDRMAMREGKIANPGPFRGEVDGFDLGAEAAREQHAFDKAASYRQAIKNLSGIRVYRDGFGVRVDRDWLRLSESATSGVSYYALRPSNTLGYVSISAQENSSLQEKTDREGFVISEAYLNFFGLLRDGFVGFSEKAQDFLRRGWLEFRKSHERELADVDPDSTPEAVVDRMRSELALATTHRASLEALASNLNDGILAASKESGTIASALKKAGTTVNSSLREHIGRLDGQLKGLQRMTSDVRETLMRVTSYLERVAAMDTLSTVLTSEIGALREQLGQVYELVSLGITAEALTHEIHHVAEQLAARNKAVADHLKRQRSNDLTLSAFTEYVRTAVAALRQQLGHLTPALRFARQKRERIDIAAFLTDLRAFYGPRLEAAGIDFIVQTERGGDFTVKMGRGKLVQVLDNLVLNSEYWLREEIRHGRLERGVIRCQVHAPHIRISDNGRGVDPALAPTIFEPFVTGKQGGRGRGLGLFIVRQLLDVEDCVITLQRKQNSHGRRYVFDLDFTGALDESES